jgi:PAS domain S-box-containing protein
VVINEVVMIKARSFSFVGVVCATVVLVFAVALLSVWQISSARSSQRSDIVAGEVDAARLAASAVEATLDSHLEVIQSLSGQFGTKIDKYLTSSGSAQVPPAVVALRLLYPDFSGFAIVNGAGRVLGSSSPGLGTIGADISSRTSFRAAMGGTPSVSARILETAGAKSSVVVFSTPLSGPAQHPAGVLEAALTGPQLAALVGGSVLGGNAGLVVFDSAGDEIVGGTSILPLTGTLYRALASGAGSLSASVPGFSGQRIVAFSPLSTLGWSALVEEPSSELNKPVGSLTERMGLIGAMVLLLLMAAAILVISLLRRLARQNEQVRAIFSSVGEGLATVDGEGRLRNVNPAFEALSGRSEAEVAGKTWAEALAFFDERGHRITVVQSLVTQAFSERQVVSTTGYERFLVTPDDRKIPVALTAAPLVTDGKPPEGAVVVMRDVTRERDVDQLKSMLVSTVSHELRTPLTMIRGFSELLLTREDLDKARQHEALEQIHSSSERLGRLIDDLLSVSRIESGKLTADLVPVSVAELVHEVLGPFKSQARQEIRLEIDSGLPPMLADHDESVQVLTNLVSNALKYSPPDSVIIVSARRKAGRAQISVIDQGIGMSEAELATAFDKFTRVHRPEVLKAGGTGLGLYITRQLVQMQGGELVATSQPGKGSTFTFILPLVNAARYGGGREEEPDVEAAHR